MAGITVVCLASAASAAMANDHDGPTVCGKPAAYWIAALRGKDRDARNVAPGALALFVPEAKEALPVLIAGLDDPKTSDLHAEIIRELRDLGPGASAAAPALTRKLGDRRFVDFIMFKATHLAGDALVAIGPSAVPALVEALGSESEKTRFWAVRTLGEIGPAARAAVPALHKKLARGRDVETAWALGRIGPDAAEAVPALHVAFDTLKPDDHYGRHIILDAMAQIGAPPSPGMIRLLDDRDPERREDAAYMLVELGAGAQAAAPRLETAMDDPSPAVRVRAATALQRIDPANPRVLKALIAALDSGDPSVIHSALDAIETYGPKAKAAVPRLNQLINVTRSVHAATTLLAVVPGSNDALASLVAFLKDSDDNARLIAIRALAELGPKAAGAAPALAAVARDPASRHRYIAIKALTRVNPDDEAIVPALVGMLNSALLDREGPNARRESDEEEIVTTLGLMGKRALPAAPALMRLVGEPNAMNGWSERLPEKAATALGRIGPDAKSAAHALVKALKLENDVRDAAGHTLESMGPAAAAESAALRNLLRSKHTRYSAVRVLGAIGPDARVAVPALVAALSDPKSGMTGDVGSALLRIDPSKRELVEACLASVQAQNDYHDSAVLLGALGHRSQEADGLTRRALRTLDKQLAEREEATAEARLSSAEFALERAEDQFRSLADLGAGAAEAIPRLTELVRHSDPLIRRLATDTLQRIASDQSGGPGGPPSR